MRAGVEGDWRTVRSPAYPGQCNPAEAAHCRTRFAASARPAASSWDAARDASSEARAEIALVRDERPREGEADVGADRRVTLVAVAERERSLEIGQGVGRTMNQEIGLAPGQERDDVGTVAEHLVLLVERDTRVRDRRVRIAPA